MNGDVPQPCDLTPLNLRIALSDMRRDLPCELAQGHQIVNDGIMERVTRSTGWPRRSSKKKFRSMCPLKVAGPQNSTRTSTSLSGRASSLAADPKMARLLIPPSRPAHPWGLPASGGSQIVSVVPMHRELKPGTLRSVLKLVKIDPVEFERRL